MLVIFSFERSENKQIIELCITSKEVKSVHSTLFNLWIHILLAIIELDSILKYIEGHATFSLSTICAKLYI
jgi:hypothetical protein